jgi:hypothetical protein
MPGVYFSHEVGEAEHITTEAMCNENGCIFGSSFEQQERWNPRGLRLLQQSSQRLDGGRGANRHRGQIAAEGVSDLRK